MKLIIRMLVSSGLLAVVLSLSPVPHCHHESHGESGRHTDTEDASNTGTATADKTQWAVGTGQLCA